MGHQNCGILHHVTPMSSEHAQAITEHFPRTEYHRLNYYVDPVARKSARVLWAARDASAEWVRATEAHDWDAVDAAMFNLAVFDKAYELYVGWLVPG